MKYVISSIKKFFGDAPVCRIVAMEEIAPDVRPGDFGGWVETEHNLSHNGRAWIYDDAVAAGAARVEGDAVLRGSEVAADNFPEQQPSQQSNQ